MMKYNDGFIYEGWWYRGKKHGMGRMTYPNNEMFYGLWNEDQKFSGLHSFADGSNFYTGNWNNN